MGKLMNDPKLYNDLTDAAEKLSKLLVELRQLAVAWKADGVKIKLK